MTYFRVAGLLHLFRLSPLPVVFPTVTYLASARLPRAFVSDGLMFLQPLFPDGFRCVRLHSCARALSLSRFGGIGVLR